VDGSGLESSHFHNRVDVPAVPFRGGLEDPTWKDQVRVVPNPFNVKGGEYLTTEAHGTTGYNYAGGNREQNQITFVNIPPQCRIRIYNSMGDFIKELNHTSGSADERWDPSITDNNQYPSSGVYFYTIEVTQGSLQGDVGTGKFVIVR
jgi:hypothetical protein